MASVRLACFWVSPVFCICLRQVLAQGNPSSNSNNNKQNSNNSHKLISPASRVKMTWRMNQLRMTLLTRRLASRESAMSMARFPCKLAAQATGEQRRAIVR